MAPNKKQCCVECGEPYVVGGTGGTAGTSSKFLPINNFLFDGYLPICNFCIEKRIKVACEKNNATPWNIRDELCQLLNIGFNPSLWEKLFKTHKFKTFIVYANMMHDTEYEKVDWRTLNKKYVALEEAQLLDEEVPELLEEKVRKLQEKWGGNYCPEELVYLENLYKGIMKSQSVNGDLQIDNAKKICKIALLIDQRIAAGSDFDKVLGTYDKLIKISDFIPKNSKNSGDFDSVGELFGWLEKAGWMNKFYDGVPQDIVDNTMKNFQSYVRNLYVNENAMPEEIDRRLEALKHVAELENKFYDEEEVDYDKYELEGYNAPKEEFVEEY